MNIFRRELDQLQGNLTMVVTIILGFLIIFLPLATIIGWYGIDRTNDSLRQATETNLSTLAEQVRDELERALIRPYQDIQTLANNEVIRSAERSPEEKLAELQGIQAFYDTLQSRYSVFLDISLIDLEGQEIASTDQGYVTVWTDKAWFGSATKGRVTVSPPRYATGGDSGDVVMDYAAPVRDKTGKVTAVIIGQMDMRTIWQITEGATLGKTGYTRIVDASGNIYAPSQMVFQEFDYPQGAELPDVYSSKLDTYDERGETMVAGYMALREQFPNWYVWVSQPYDEAFGPIQSTVRSLMFGVMGGVLLFAIMSAVWIWRAMRPVRDLSFGAEKIGSGDLAHRVPVSGPTEIRRLATSFNEMAGNLERAEAIRAEHGLLRKLQAASLALASAVSPNEVVRIISNGVKDLLSCDTVWLLLADRCDEYLETKSIVLPEKRQLSAGGQSSPALVVERQVDLIDNNDLMTKTFTSGNPVFLGFPAQRGELAEIDPYLNYLVTQLGLISLNLVPLMLPGRNMGLIVFGRSSGQPLSDEEKRIVLVFAHEASISLERARLHVQELQSRAELSRLNDLKSRLLHILSHELKTPLTSLRTSARLLYETDANRINPSTQERLRGSILRATERLMAVADDIYPIASVLTDEVRVEPRETDCRRIVHGAVEVVSPLAESKGQTVTVSVAPSVGTVWADKDRLKEALVRLLTNASKFSPSNSTIEVVVHDEPSEVIFQVKDHGPGISEEDQKSIFDGFYQANSELVRRAGGRGLGLLFAKAIVERHQGKIWVKSKIGDGSSFYFSIPKTRPTSDALL